MPPQHDPPAPKPLPDGGETDKTSTRHPYTNDALAGLLVVFAVAATAAYVYRGAAVPMWLAGVDTLAILSAVIWAFGKGTVKEARKLIEN